MREIQFSIAEHFDNADAFFHRIASLDPALGIVPQTTPVPWPIMWSFLHRTATEERGLDVSEVGTTWVGSFARLGALREITPDDMTRLGGASRFLPSVWRSASQVDDQRVLSIPWMADARLVFYWKDALDDAGVDEEHAFDTPAHMEDTLSRISAAGWPAWGAPTFGVTNTIHQVASWIWAGGGDFVTPDGRACEFLNPEAFEGIVAYFDLHRFMNKRFDSLDAVIEAFENREVAVIIDGPWFLKRMTLRGATKEDFDNLGAALPPGPPFVGGSNLVVWRRDNQENSEAALSWVAHLVSPEVQRRICEASGLLPVLSEMPTGPLYESTPHYQMFKLALEKGRPMPRISRWGALEEALVKAVGNIWSDLKEDPRLEVDTTVLQYLTPVANRFDEILGVVSDLNLRKHP
jgi:multiple sugar transport system substrate-binding protein